MNTTLRVCGTCTETWRTPCPEVPGRRKDWTSQTAQQAVLLAVDRFGPGILRWSVWSEAGRAPSAHTLLLLFGSWDAIRTFISEHSRVAS